MELGKKYGVDFGSVSSGVMRFSVEEKYDEVMVVAECADYRMLGKYEMVLAQGSIPSMSNYDIMGKQLGALRKAIKLSPTSPTNFYYLLLSG